MRKFPKKKTYGSYKTSSCPFCGKTATQQNEQGIDVCRFHTKQVLGEVKCTCGGWLEPRSGKFGPYFHCDNCGNLNYKKGMEIKEIITPIEIDKPEQKRITSTTKLTFSQTKSTFSQTKSIPSQTSTFKSKPKEITITSNDVEYFD